MLMWNNGSWEHRAFWGANFITYGVNGTAGRRYVGTLPTAGQWVRLEVPASQMGLEGGTVKGMAFYAVGGRATWDKAGKSSQSSPPPTLPIVAVSATDGNALAPPPRLEIVERHVIHAGNDQGRPFILLFKTELHVFERQALAVADIKSGCGPRTKTAW